MEMKKGYLPTSRCSECKGICCKSLPGTLSPKDIEGDIYEDLKARILTGFWCVDWYEGDPRKGKNKFWKVYFVRPSTIDKKGVVLDPSWGGQCSLLTNIGCSLSFRNRPKECRMLEPGVRDCKNHTDKRKVSIEWIPYQKILKKLLRNIHTH
jgi:hypothetical protein